MSDRIVFAKSSLISVDCLRNQSLIKLEYFNSEATLNIESLSNESLQNFFNAFTEVSRKFAISISKNGVISILLASSKSV